MRTLRTADCTSGYAIVAIDIGNMKLPNDVFRFDAVVVVTEVGCFILAGAWIHTIGKQHNMDTLECGISKDAFELGV
jgi:hypothetical protein